MQPITVAVVDINQEKRAQMEQFLQQSEENIEILSDATSNYVRIKDRRLKSRANITLIEDIVARIRRLNPRILLANTQQLSGVYCSLLIALRHYCPETRVVLLIDEAIEENQMLKALANGARGFLSCRADSLSFSKAVYAVDQGEAWIPRKMLGKIMDNILYVSRRQEFFRGSF